MPKTILALATLTAIIFAGAAEARHRHHARHTGGTDTSACAALRHLHAQVGTQGLEIMAQQAGVTASQRSAAIACLRRR